MDWDGKLYETSHSFVSAYGVDVLDMLGGISGKTVLDAGCGTGTLAAEAQRRGARQVSPPREPKRESTPSPSGEGESAGNQTPEKTR